MSHPPTYMLPNVMLRCSSDSGVDADSGVDDADDDAPFFRMPFIGDVASDVGDRWPFAGPPMLMVTRVPPFVAALIEPFGAPNAGASSC